MSGSEGKDGAGVGPLEAEELIDQGAMLLDVREPSEWDAGHAPVAVHVPLGDLAAEIEDIPADQRIVVVCRSGGRSARATAFLVGSGRDAVNLEGGMQAWAAADLPVEGADGAPGHIT